jgi:hypothetical protein
MEVPLLDLVTQGVVRTQVLLHDKIQSEKTIWGPLLPPPYVGDFLRFKKEIFDIKKNWYL